MKIKKKKNSNTKKLFKKSKKIVFTFSGLFQVFIESSLKVEKKITRGYFVHLCMVNKLLTSFWAVHIGVFPNITSSVAQTSFYQRFSWNFTFQRRQCCHLLRFMKIQITGKKFSLSFQQFVKSLNQYWKMKINFTIKIKIKNKTALIFSLFSIFAHFSLAT